MINRSAPHPTGHDAHRLYGSSGNAAGLAARHSLTPDSLLLDLPGELRERISAQFTLADFRVYSEISRTTASETQTERSALAHIMGCIHSIDLNVTPEYVHSIVIKSGELPAGRRQEVWWRIGTKIRSTLEQTAFDDQAVAIIAALPEAHRAEVFTPLFERTPDETRAAMIPTLLSSGFLEKTIASAHYSNANVLLHTMAQHAREEDLATHELSITRMLSGHRIDRLPTATHSLMLRVLALSLGERIPDFIFQISRTLSDVARIKHLSPQSCAQFSLMAAQIATVRDIGSARRADQFAILTHIEKNIGVMRDASAERSGDHRVMASVVLAGFLSTPIAADLHSAAQSGLLDIVLAAPHPLDAIRSPLGQFLIDDRGHDFCSADYERIVETVYAHLTAPDPHVEWIMHAISALGRTRSQQQSETLKNGILNAMTFDASANAAATHAALESLVLREPSSLQRDCLAPILQHALLSLLNENLELDKRYTIAAHLLALVRRNRPFLSEDVRTTVISEILSAGLRRSSSELRMVAAQTFLSAYEEAVISHIPFAKLPAGSGNRLLEYGDGVYVGTEICDQSLALLAFALRLHHFERAPSAFLGEVLTHFENRVNDHDVAQATRAVIRENVDRWSAEAARAAEQSSSRSFTYAYTSESHSVGPLVPVLRASSSFASESVAASDA